MINKLKLYCLIIVAGFITYSCKTLNVSRKNVESSASTVNIIKEKFNNSNYPENLLIRNASLKILDENQTSLRLTVYMKKDKLIFINGRYMGFEVFRMMLDSDSVKFINRFQRSYYFDDTKDFLVKYGLTPDLSELQEFIYTGFLFPETFNTNFIRTNFIKKEDNIHYDYIIDNGRKMNLNYDLQGQLKNLLFSDHQNEIFVNMEMIRNNSELKSITGDYIKSGNKIDWALNINQLDYSNFDNLDFRIGKNYYEIQSIF